MDDSQENFRVAESEPSRPGKITVIGLIGLVIGFFVLVFTAGQGEIERQKKAAQAQVSTTQAPQSQ